MTPEQIAGWLQIGGAGLMLGALFLGFKKVWVWGWIYQAKVDECEEWKRMALKSVGLTAAAMTTPLTPEQANQAQQVIQNSAR